VALAVALAAAGCARQQHAYYVIDPATGRPVPVVQQYAPPPSQQTAQYPQPAYQQQAYAPQPVAQPAYQPPVAQSATAPDKRGVFSSSAASVQQAYDQQVYADANYQQSAYQQPAAQQSAPSTGRGLFTSRKRTPVYSQQPAYVPAPTYAPQPAPQAAPQYGTGGPYVPAPNAYAYAPPNGAPAYTLDSGDKLRVVVFGQDGITNSYTVDAGGNIMLPLVGSVPARGVTTQQLSQMIAERLKQGYVREPHVSVEVETYRPFFILGEVTTPGQYPYVANMTAETAVAIAGGFGARADKRKVELTRNAPGQQIRGSVPMNYPLRPGDTIVVKERWF
jgi:polysaccharide export outer membrane protein